ncbi:MAG TPA: hypothetical protein VD971_04765 [Phycisphaerales bacterium]|nr:hypothetical protein [Phycisphaerales bacterium]
MIACAYFDPSCLAIWINADFVTRHEEPHRSEQLQLFLRSACANTPIATLADGLSALQAPADAARAAHLASTVLHEKRHFLDVLLTNYGALLFRRYAQVAVHTPQILSLALRSGKKLYMPLEAWADPVRSTVMDAPPCPDELRRLCSDMRKRHRMVLEDNSPVEHGSSSVSVGGDSQLEALAVMCQTDAMSYLVGPAETRSTWNSFGLENGIDPRIRWVYAAGSQMGLLPIESLGDDTYIGDFSLVTPILIAALMCRLWGQPQSDENRSYLPSVRMATLMTDLKGTYRSFGGLTPDDAFELVDNACTRLFGRSILEELEADLDLEGVWVSKVSAMLGPRAHESRAVADYHRLRQAVAAEFRSRPGSLCASPYFLKNSHRLAPLCVFAHPHAHPPDTSGRTKRLIGYRFDKTPFANDPAVDLVPPEWWWASVSADWPPTSEDFISLRDDGAWIRFLEFNAPIAKLAFTGFRHESMLGPEFVTPVMRIEAELGIETVIEPAYRYPENTEKMALFWRLVRLDAVRCDFCNESIPRDEGHALSPWLFRRSPRNLQAMQEHYGGGALGYALAIQDWGSWVICDKCHTSRVVGL